MDPLDDDAIAQPRCPNDGTIMRTIPEGWECGECRHFEPVAAGPLPPEFDGPSIQGG
ncbi:hypothetical protein [Microbacterium aurantiacum]|uniref:hypothetical protein n=1 Tax=Microbacterium aurantiacum TaxID=162393 RepID=UPI0015E14FAD|nr:hypothetical protein [Microbacterium aurantiacum]